MKKKCIHMFLGIFPIACVREKMFICIFFSHFPIAGNRKKMKKKTKKQGEENLFWLLPNCIVKFNFFFIVLQPCNCIAREKAGKFFLLQLHCKRRATVLQYGVDWPGIILQYLYCIAT